MITIRIEFYKHFGGFLYDSVRFLLDSHDLLDSHGLSVISIGCLILVL